MGTPQAPIPESSRTCHVELSGSITPSIKKFPLATKTVNSNFKETAFPIKDYSHSTMSLVPSIFGRRSNVFDPFSLEVWDPFEGFPISFPQRSDFLSSETSSVAHAKVDWKETPTAHVFKADVPGLKKEEVKVEVEDGRVLQISGERSHKREEKNDTWHRVERSSGKFSRRFRLPENAKVEEVKAAMEDGVLTVTVPKVEAKNSDVRSIHISG
jgi:HSP20 family protein